MCNLRLRRWNAGLATIGGLAMIVFGCSGTTPPNPVRAPDVSKITVFFPVDGLVRGHGEVDAVDRGTQFLEVAAHPTGTKDHFPVNTDGSFDFGIIAISEDILEIAAVQDRNDAGKGDISYVRVPIGVEQHAVYVCCGSTTDAQGMVKPGTCQSRHDADLKLTCPNRTTGATECTIPRDCFKENGEILLLSPKDLSISSPSKDGKITIFGKTQIPHGLLHLENRGQRGVGGFDRGLRTAIVMDKDGGFHFPNLVARGDDELVFQIHDLEGNLSPEMSILTPDAQLEAFDVLGVYGYNPVVSGQTTQLAVRYRPRGIDGFGICPDSMANPILCLSGGLTHDMVSIDRLNFGCSPDTSDSIIAHPVAASQVGSVVSNHGTEGDVAAGPKAVVFVVDMSDSAQSDNTYLRIDAIQGMIRSLPSDALAGVASYGKEMPTTETLMPGAPELKNCTMTGTGAMSMMIQHASTRETGMKDSQNGTWASQISTLDGMRTRPAKGVSDVYGAIVEAATMLDELALKHTREGVIVVLVAGDFSTERQAGCIGRTRAINHVAENVDMGIPGYATHIIGINLRPVSSQTTIDPRVLNVNNLADIALSSGSAPFGSYRTVQSAGKCASPPCFPSQELVDTLGFLNGALSGDFVLLYDVPVPCCFKSNNKVTVNATGTLVTLGAATTMMSVYETTGITAKPDKDPSCSR